MCVCIVFLGLNPPASPPPWYMHTHTHIHARTHVLIPYEWVCSSSKEKRWGRTVCDRNCRSLTEAVCRRGGVGGVGGAVELPLCTEQGFHSGCGSGTEWAPITNSGSPWGSGVQATWIRVRFPLRNLLPRLLLLLTSNLLGFCLKGRAWGLSLKGHVGWQGGGGVCVVNSLYLHSADTVWVPALRPQFCVYLPPCVFWSMSHWMRWEGLEKTLGAVLES